MRAAVAFTRQERAPHAELARFAPARSSLLRSNHFMQTAKRKLENGRRPVREGRLVTVGRVCDVPPGRGATVELKSGAQVALYNVGGEFYALENFCPHRGAPLADGKLCGQTVTCDLHGWRFDVRTGACLGRMDAHVETYQVVIEDGTIKILI